MNLTGPTGARIFALLLMLLPGTPGAMPRLPWFGPDAASAELPAQSEAPDVQGPAVDFALRSTSGRNARLSEFRGRPVVLTFWSSRCGSCDRHVDALAERLGRYADSGAQLLVVSIDRTPERSVELARRLGQPVLLDAEREVARAYELTPLPVTHLVDPHGRMRSDRRSARKPEPDQIEAALRALLAE